MKRSRAWIRPAILAVLLLALSGWLYLEHVDPRYNGRRTSEWLIALGSESEEEYKEAVLAVFVLGERAVPQITKFFYTPESEWRDNLYDWVEDKTDWDIKRQDAVDLRSKGEAAVEIIGKRAAPLIPRLIESLGDDEFCSASLWALKIIGEAANDSLVAALKHQNERIRIQAILLLVERKQADIIPQLKEFLTSGSLEIRALSIESLVALGLPKDEALPLLTPLLKHKDNRLRVSAVNALGALAESDTSLLPEFLAYAVDADTEVRLMVFQRLHRLDPSNAAVTDILIAGLKDSDERTQEASLKELSIQFTGGYLGFSLLRPRTVPRYDWVWDFQPKREVKFSGSRLYPRADEFISALKEMQGKSSEIGASAKIVLLFFDPKLRHLSEEMLVLIDKSEQLEKEDHQARAAIKIEIDTHLIKLNNVDPNMTIAFLLMVVRFLEQQDRYLLPR